MAAKGNLTQDFEAEIAAKHREVFELLGLDATAESASLSEKEKTQFDSSDDVSVTLSTKQASDYLQDLLTLSSTDTQWLVGRKLLRQLTLPALKPGTKEKRRGPARHDLDRIFVLVYLEWRFQRHEDDFKQALHRTGELFVDPPTERLTRWYSNGKGEYAKERRFAKHLVDLAIIYQTHEDSPHKGQPPPLI